MLYRISNGSRRCCVAIASNYPYPWRIHRVELGRFLSSSNEFQEDVSKQATSEAKPDLTMVSLVDKLRSDTKNSNESLNPTDELPHNPRRRHFLSKAQLQAHTEHIQSMIKRRKAVSRNQAFDILEAWMERAEIDGISAAYTIAKLYNSLGRQPKGKDSIDLFHVNVVLEACAKCRGKGPAALLAEDVFRRKLTTPNAKSYNILMKCWARSYAPNAGQKAEQLFNKMIDESIPIDERTIVSYMEAWINSKVQDAPERVNELLQRILHERSLLHHETPPIFAQISLEASVFHGLIRAWAVSGRGRKGAQQAERVIDIMLRSNAQPNTITYSLVATAWGDCERLETVGDAAGRAEAILQKMIDYGMAVNTVLFTTCIAAWSKATRCTDAPERAERLFYTLKALHESSGCKKSMFPSVEAENAVLSAWARSRRPDAFDRCRNFLDRMMARDRISYNTMLDCYASRGLSKHALSLLEEMRGHDAKSIHPDVISYNSALKALARDPSASLDDVDRLLQHMEDIMTPIDPDKVSYTCALDAWARSSNPQKVLKCRELVDAMVYRYQMRDKRKCKPDVYVFTTLIKACVYSDDPISLRIATNAMKQLETAFGPPNDVAFAMYLRALIKHSGSKEDISQLIKSCAKHGWVSNLVVRELQKAGNILETPMSLLDDQDASWSRNVQEGDRPNLLS